MSHWLSRLLLLLLVAWAVAQAPPQSLPAAPAVAGQMRQVDSIRLVILSGSPFEMGLQQGALLRYEIRQAVAHQVHGAIVAGYVTHRELRALAAQIRQFIPSRLNREMHGIAAASAIAYEDILLLNVVPELLTTTSDSSWRYQFQWSALLQKEPRSEDPAGAGTIFASWGSATQNHDLLMGYASKTCFSPAIEPQLWTVRRPAGGNAVAGLSYAGRVGLCAGLNDEQVAAVASVVPSADDSWNASPLSWILRLALQDSGDALATAMSVLSSSPAGGANVILGDGKVPEATMYQVTAHRHATVEREPGSILASTNHFLDEALAPLHQSALADGYLRNSLSRLDQLDGWLTTNNGLMDVVRGLEIVRTSDASPCQSARVLLYPARLTVWVFPDDASASSLPVKIGLSDVLYGS